MTILSYAVCALLALGYVAIVLAVVTAEEGLGNGWASVAVACLMFVVGVGAAMAARDREARG